VNAFYSHATIRYPCLAPDNIGWRVRAIDSLLRASRWTRFGVGRIHYPFTDITKTGSKEHLCSVVGSSNIYLLLTTRTDNRSCADVAQSYLAHASQLRDAARHGPDYYNLPRSIINAFHRFARGWKLHMALWEYGNLRQRNTDVDFMGVTIHAGQFIPYMESDRE
jgi:hypothetical protein